MKFWTKVIALLGGLLALIVGYDIYVLATSQPQNGLYVLPLGLLTILGVCVAWKRHEEETDRQARLDESASHALRRLKELNNDD